MFKEKNKRSLLSPTVGYERKPWKMLGYSKPAPSMQLSFGERITQILSVIYLGIFNLFRHRVKNVSPG
jgi:hypothetical protein